MWLASSKILKIIKQMTNKKKNKILRSQFNLILGQFSWNHWIDLVSLQLFGLFLPICQLVNKPETLSLNRSLKSYKKLTILRSVQFARKKEDMVWNWNVLTVSMIIVWSHGLNKRIPALVAENKFNDIYFTFVTCYFLNVFKLSTSQKGQCMILIYSYFKN